MMMSKFDQLSVVIFVLSVLGLAWAWFATRKTKRKKVDNP